VGIMGFVIAFVATGIFAALMVFQAFTGSGNSPSVTNVRLVCEDTLGVEYDTPPNNGSQPTDGARWADGPDRLK